MIHELINLYIIYARYRDTQHNDIQHKNTIECHYAGRYILFIALLSIVMLHAITLSVVKLNAIILIVVVLNAITQSVGMLNAIVLSVVMLNAITVRWLSVDGQPPHRDYTWCC